MRVHEPIEKLPQELLINSAMNPMDERIEAFLTDVLARLKVKMRTQSAMAYVWLLPIATKFSARKK
jgi:hypothetical protein